MKFKANFLLTAEQADMNNLLSLRCGPSILPELLNDIGVKLVVIDDESHYTLHGIEYRVSEDRHWNTLWNESRGFALNKLLRCLLDLVP